MVAPSVDCVMPSNDSRFNENLPVNLDQFDTFGGNHWSGIGYLLDVYLRDTGRDIEKIKSALDEGNGAEAAELARACRCSSDVFGMVAVIPPLELLERSAAKGVSDDCFEHWAEFKRQFERIQLFLVDLPMFQRKAA